MIIRKISFLNELLLVLYFWGFTYLKPILQSNESNSSQILFLYALSLILTSFVNSYINKKIRIGSLSIVLVFCIIFFLDIILRYNDYTLKYFYEFIIFGVIPLFLVSQINYPKKFLLFYSYFSIIAIFLFWNDPLNEYAYFGSYMSYGFELALPAFLGIHIGRRFLRQRWMIPLEILSFLLVLLFSSRSPLIGIIIFLVLTDFVTKKSNLKNKFKYIFFIFSFLVFVSFFQPILNFLIQISEQFDINSVNLHRLSIYLETMNLNNIFTGRIELWDKAIQMFYDNPLFGAGTGAFEAKYGIYSHNIILDILLQYGIIFFFVMVFFIIKSFKNIYRSEYFSSILGLLFFSLWVPKLLLSIYFYREIGFWMFLAYGLFTIHHNFQKRKFIPTKF